MTTAIEAGKAFVSLGVKSSLNKDLAKSKATLRKFAKVTTKLMAGVAAAGFGVATASLAKLVNEAKELRKLSGEINLTTQELQELDYISKQVGLDLEDMVGGIEELRIRLAEAAQDGVGPLSDMFEKLGMDVNKFIGMGTIQQIALISEELNGLGAEAKQFAADEIFGGDGRRLMNVFNMGAEGILNMAEEARRLGLVFSQDTMNGLTSIGDAWLDLELEFQSVIGNMASDWASEMEMMVAFTRLVSKDILAVWGTTVAQMTGMMGQVVASSLRAVGLGDTTTAQVGQAMGEDAVRKSEAQGAEMARMILQQRERRAARAEQRATREKAAQAAKTSGSFGGTTVPTADELNAGVRDTFSSAFPDLGGDEDKFGRNLIGTSALGSFVGGSGVGQGAMQTVQENQLQEAKKTNDWLQKIATMADINQGGGSTVFTGGQ